MSMAKPPKTKTRLYAEFTHMGFNSLDSYRIASDDFKSDDRAALRHAEDWASDDDVKEWRMRLAEMATEAGDATAGVRSSSLSRISREKILRKRDVALIEFADLVRPGALDSGNSNARGQMMKVYGKVIEEAEIAEGRKKDKVNPMLDLLDVLMSKK